MNENSLYPQYSDKLNKQTNNKTEKLHATADYYKLLCILAVNTAVSLCMTNFSCFPLELLFLFLVLQENFIGLHIQILH